MWPNIEMDAESTFRHHQTVFHHAGNKHGWHVCTRCDGHLHVDGHLDIAGVGDAIYDVSLGTQDFTDKITILTNGRPHGISDACLAQAKEHIVEIVEDRIVRHIGHKTELLALELEGGRQLEFSRFLVDEGLEPNTPYFEGWNFRADDKGLIVVDEDRQLMDGSGNKIDGLFAAGDIVSGERNLIATAFALGQDARLAASDSLRQWK